ncbi:uncharacterized protein LOC134224472 [Armigeres subalbatus]|uniref:uncharacterized protein LOC134224472 n=1 Tax=Armigeres subalbatus TaxID=124917 RepID=UPI002ED4CCEF
MTILSSGENCGTPAPPPPPPPSSASTSPLPRLNSADGSTPDKNMLMVDIRNGITLKPTKTKDKSTPSFIKKSGGANSSPSSPPAQLNGISEDTSFVGMKDALQEELRNTLKRKVKKQDVERGDSTKKDEIEKAMETNRTEVQLKVNTGVKASPSLAHKDVLNVAKTTNGVQSVPSRVVNLNNVPNGSVVNAEHKKTSPMWPRKEIVNTSPVKSNGVQLPHVNQQQLKPTTDLNGSKSSIDQRIEPKQNSFPQSAPPKPARLLQNDVVENKKPVESSAISNGIESVKRHTPMKVEIKPFDSSKTPLNGTLRKVNHQKDLTIDVDVSQDDRLKNTILSPGVKSGTASIRPSQIKSLTKQGSHVSHIDILENPKPINKSPISLKESPNYSYTPPTPKSISPASSGQASPRTPTRTTILDTRISNSLITPKPDPSSPQKKLMISHPKASFTLKRGSSASQQNFENTQSTEPKPVFRILSNLEQSERVEADREAKTLPRQSPKKVPPKADEPGVEPVLTSYVSFAKELANAPNNYPDTVTKHTTVGVLKQDLFFDNTNLRDIKIDIIEGGGQLKVVNK